MTLRTVLAPAALVAAIAATVPAKAETYVLVHGAFQTGAAWSEVAALLDAGGDSVTVVDLPGRPGDGRAPGEVTFDDHVAAVAEAVAGAAAADPDGRVVLVGHSFGGLVISAVAERDPAPIASLIYVAAYLPQVDAETPESLQSLATADHHGGWQADSFVVAADYSTASVNPRDRAGLFANDADDARAAAVADAMVDEPLAPLATPVPVTSGRFGTVRAAYVVTLRDRAVSTDLQLTMIGRGRVAEAVPVNTGHTPHLTDPEATAAAIRRAASPELE